MIIDMRRAVLLLPIYVALMVGVDALFNSAGLNTRNDLPLWLVIAFTIMALAVFVIVAWFLVQKVRGKVPVKRERAYAGFLIALVISGFVDDGLKGLTSLLFHSRSIWISIPVYILSYVVLLAVGVYVLRKVAVR
jgi:predicted permease